MATIYKPPGRSRYIIEYRDENGKRRRKTGATDKAVTERLARDLENKVLLRREGLIDDKAESFKGHNAKPLVDHLDAWTESLEAKGTTPKHAKLFSSRARRIVALLMGAKLSEIESASDAKRVDIARAEASLTKSVTSARLSDLTPERVQKALATLKTEGRSLATCNHHRAAIKAFSKWCHDTHRTREDVLRAVKGFNAKEDRRHDRRTISLDELRRLVEAAQQGPVVLGVSGPVRALCYRLAVATGLRYSEISSITPEVFDWQSPSVTVAACYTKNGDQATIPLPIDLVEDLAAYVSTLPPETPVFPLQTDKGAKMLRRDLEAAGIDYQDASGQFFDFHSLRCQMATNADAAGVTPRVVQKMMRHSTLELTGRYTKPRVVDIEAASSLLPSLRPEGDKPESQIMTGTCSTPVSFPVTPQNTLSGNADGCKVMAGQSVMTNERRSHIPQVMGSSPVPGIHVKNCQDSAKIITIDGELSVYLALTSVYAWRRDNRQFRRVVTHAATIRVADVDPLGSIAVLTIEA